MLHSVWPVAVTGLSNESCLLKQFSSGYEVKVLLLLFYCRFTFWCCFAVHWVIVFCVLVVTSLCLWLLTNKSYIVQVFVCLPFSPKFSVYVGKINWQSSGNSLHSVMKLNGSRLGRTNNFCYMTHALTSLCILFLFANIKLPITPKLHILWLLCALNKSQIIVYPSEHEAWIRIQRDASVIKRCDFYLLRICWCL